MDNMDFSRHRFCPESEEKPFNRSLIDTACRSDGVYVFDFHPIHLLLNTQIPNTTWLEETDFLLANKLQCFDTTVTAHDPSSTNLSARCGQRPVTACR